MKNFIATILAVAALGTAAAVPRVSNVTLKQDARHRAVVTYTLAEAPGIVTFEILTNGVPLAANLLTNAVGDVNRLVQPSPERTISWEPWHTWPGQKLAGGVSARVTVWPTNAPPDYLAIELTKSTCPVTYYASEAALPWGKVWENKVYKGDVLLMKRIHASHVLSLMGSPETEANHVVGRETRRLCTLTNDFYIGIFPVTCRHHYLLGNPASTESRLTPVFNQSYNMLRYSTNNWANSALPINFPKTGRTTVGGASILQSWRTKTGLVLDLPTSAQWEFACRAGTTTPIYTHPFCNGTMEQLSTIADITSFDGVEVGCRGCNSWGLYDMLGNRYEYCLDYFEDAITDEPVTDPLGPDAEASLRRKIRGFNASINYWRSAFFTAASYTEQRRDTTFRFCITLP